VTIALIWREHPTPSFLELPSLHGHQFTHKKCIPETSLKTPASVKNFEFITTAMLVASVAVFVYQNSTTKLFGPTAAVYVATAVIMNLFLIYTITRAKSIVSRTFFAMANGLGIAFCLVSLFGVSPLNVKIGVGVAAYLYIYLIVAFASLYLLFSPATTKWLQNEDPIEFD
jgi:hypothetical protein